MTIRKRRTIIEVARRGRDGQDGSGTVNIDIDATLAANSNTRVPSQRAVKTYVDSNSGGGVTTGSIEYELHGGDGVVAVGESVMARLNFPATFTGWQVFSRISGSISCSIKKHTYAQGPITGTEIHGTQKPSLSSTTKNQSTTWSATAAAGETISIYVDSATTVMDVYVSLFYVRFGM